jgi:polysaccharide export outer membrane protein
MHCQRCTTPTLQLIQIIISMTRTFRILLFLILGALTFTSCGTYEEYVLLNDVATPHEYAAPERHDLHIKRGDDLQILVGHHIPKLIESFNRKVSVEGEGDQMNSYRVNSRGYISFPVFDTIYVLGMTCRQLEEYLENRIEDEGFASNPTVQVKIKNFKVSVIGESGNGVYEFDKENVTILDLLSQANLLGGNGIRRDKILIMRDCDSTLKMDYVNILSTDIIYSPYYYLQQNDIIYVYPSQTTIRQSNRLFDFWWGRLSVVTTALSVATLFITLFSKNSSSN